MNQRKLILIGGGGHCKSCIDVIEQEGNYEIYGILDKEELVGLKLLDYQIIGTDKLIPSLVEEKYSFLITMGQIKTASLRKRIFNELIKLEANVVSIISPKAFVSRHANIGAGTIVMHGVYINADVNIGKNNIINTGAIIEHDTTVGNHCHISTNVVINGTCVVANEVFIGSGTTTMNNITISDSIVVGAGALVNRDLNQPGTYIGNPIKEI